MNTANQQLDEQFIVFMLEVDNRYKQLSKHERSKVEQWVRKRCVYFRVKRFAVAMVQLCGKEIEICTLCFCLTKF